MAKLDITSHERSALRAAAHPLRPVVLIGDRGLSESVLKEIDMNLTAHELIKVRVAGEDREARELLLHTVCDTLACAPVHHMGRTLILYRPKTSADEDTEFTTRAVRKRSEPHTPKKMAAEGLTRTRHGRTTRTTQPKPAAAAPRRAASARSASSDTASQAHNIPRRARGGSALTLRAGGRRGPSKAHK